MNGVADLVVHGPAFTADASGSWTDAVAIQDGVIIALGSKETAKVTHGTTEVVEAEGGLVLPGFQDAHIHAPFAGLNRLHVDLEHAAGPDEYLAIIADYAANQHHSEWVIGGGWALEHFDDGIPSKELLDRVCPDRPVFLFSRDFHQGWVNSEALRRAGIDRSTPDPDNGRIERDTATGHPIGTLQEAAAYDFNTHHVPQPSQTAWEAAITEAQSHLWSYGLTGWQDAWVTPATAAAYDAMAEDGRLKNRIVGAQWWEWERGTEQIPRFVDRRERYAHPRFSVGTVKIMIDGVVENYTGALLEPYCDGCGTHTKGSGMMHVDESMLSNAVVELDALGFQVHMHAIGDRAVRAGLDAIEAAREANGATSNRHHIAHVEIVQPDDIQRFRTLNVIANCQAAWAQIEPQVAELTLPRLGEERMHLLYPFGDFERAGVTLALGSDWGVTTPDPLEQIEVATTRSNPHDPHAVPLTPHQRLTLPTAVRAFTAGSAFVNHDDFGGSLGVGMRGDLAILDRNIFDPSRGRPSEARVTHTVIRGEQVFVR